MRTETQELKHIIHTQQTALEVIGKALANRTHEVKQAVELLDTGKVIMEELIARLDLVQALMMEHYNLDTDSYTIAGAPLRNAVAPRPRHI